MSKQPILLRRRNIIQLLTLSIAIYNFWLFPKSLVKLYMKIWEKIGKRLKWSRILQNQILMLTQAFVVLRLYFSDYRKMIKLYLYANFVDNFMQNSRKRLNNTEQTEHSWSGVKWSHKNKEYGRLVELYDLSL